MQGADDARGARLTAVYTPAPFFDVRIGARRVRADSAACAYRRLLVC